MTSLGELLPYLLIAPLTASVGWVTNLLGIKMLFHPIHFVGLGGFIGWQGIIPRLRVRLTRNLVTLSVANICSSREIVKALEESETVAQLEALVEPYLNDWIEDIIEEQNIRLWQFTLPVVKARVYDRIRHQLPVISRAVLAELGERADSLLDIEELAVARVENRPELLTDLFMRCAGQEMRFIVRSGLYFGLPLGVIQASVWYVYPAQWVLPAFGVFVGAATNWLALKLIAHPADPIKIGPFALQGLYLRRQGEVSQEFAACFTEKFLDTRVLLAHLWSGPKSAEVHRIVNRQVRKSLDSSVLNRMVAQFAISQDGLDSMKRRSIDYTADRLLETFDNPEVSRRFSKPISQLIAGRMEKLPPKEFQQLLLPAFEQDQLLVVLLGGVLGGLAGFAQLVWLF